MCASADHVSLDAITKKYPKGDRPDRPFSTLPIDVLDRILADGSLTLRDHLALAGTNQALRQLYTEDVWAALLLDRAQYSYFDLAIVRLRRCRALAHQRRR